MAAVKQHSTVVGVFEDRRRADEAVAELRNAGFRNDQIGVAMRQADGTSTAAGSAEGDKGSHASEGAVAGVLTGLGLGALAGIGVLAGVIPVIGPAIAGGTLGVILSNAAAGAGIAGLVGALVGAGVPEEEAKYYQDEFEAGRTIVTIHADGRGDEAAAVMRRFGGYDISNRNVAAATGAAYAPGAAQRSHAKAGEGDTIKVHEERLRVEKQPVEAGEVRVRKEVHTENRTIEVPVEREEVVIERRPVGGGAASSGAIGQGEELRIPVREEHVNVSKEAVVTEEVKVGKRVVKDTEKVSGQVRKEEVRVEQKGDVDVRNRDAGGKSR